MDETIIRTVVAALRDTAAKCDEKRTEERADMHDMMAYGSGAAKRAYEVETYSRDWISGRLLGMADMIEATLPTT